MYISNDKEKIREFSDLRRLQLPTRLEISNFRSDVDASTSTNSISPNSGNVNPSGENTSRNLEDGNKRDSRRSNNEVYRFLSKPGSVDAQYISDTVMSRATLQTASRLEWEKPSILLTPALMVVK